MQNRRPGGGGGCGINEAVISPNHTAPTALPQRFTTDQRRALIRAALGMQALLARMERSPRTLRTSAVLFAALFASIHERQGHPMRHRNAAVSKAALACWARQFAAIAAACDSIRRADAAVHAAWSYPTSSPEFGWWETHMQRRSRAEGRLAALLREWPE